MKPLPLLLAAALLLAACNRDTAHAALTPAPAALAPEGVVALTATPPAGPARRAEPDPQPTPQEVSAFNAKVPK